MQSSSPTSTLACILGNALEAIIHEILYTVSLYPRDTFTATRYLGITCHACRHPGVVQYIHDALLVALPALIAGSVDELVLILYDDDYVDTSTNANLSTNRIVASTRVLQRFVFYFQALNMIQAGDIFDKDQELYESGKVKYQSNQEENISKTVAQRIQDLERSLRDVLLKIISMDGFEQKRIGGHPPVAFSDTTTFKLCLHRSQDWLKSFVGSTEEGGSMTTTTTTTTSAPTTCEALRNVLDQGTWVNPEDSTCEIQRPGGDEIQVKIRPLRSIHVPSCGLSMQLLMESQS